MHNYVRSMLALNEELPILFHEIRDVGLLYYIATQNSSTKRAVDLAISIYYLIANTIFWTIFAISKDVSLRLIVEREADACLLSDGDIDIANLHESHHTINLILEIMRLAPLRNLILFDSSERLVLRNRVVKPGNRLIICPNIIFRANKYFHKSDEIRIDRKYDPGLPALQYLACGGRIVFRLAQLNVVLFLLDLAAAFELELVDGPDEFRPTTNFGNVRPDIKVRTQSEAITAVPLRTLPWHRRSVRFSAEVNPGLTVNFLASCTILPKGVQRC